MRASVFLACALVVGCGKKSDWGETDKIPISNFMKSLELVNEAHAISNRMGAGIHRAGAQMDKMVRLYERAYLLSTKATPECLAKAHPDLPEKYKNCFQEGVRLRLESWSGGAADAEIQGSALMDAWGDWYKGNQLRIPSRMVVSVE